MKIQALVFYFISLGIFLNYYCSGNKIDQPTGDLPLTLRERALDQVLRNGYPVNIPLNEAVNRRENFQFTEIGHETTLFRVDRPFGKNNTLQVAYQLLVSSTPEKINKDGDIWIPENRINNQSVSVVYSGKPLEPAGLISGRLKHGTIMERNHLLGYPAI